MSAATSPSPTPPHRRSPAGSPMERGSRWSASPSGAIGANDSTDLRRHGIGLGCEGHVAKCDGLLTPAPDNRQTTIRVARANVPAGRTLTETDDRLVQMDRTRTVTNRGGCAIGTTRQAEETDATRNSQRWPMGGSNRRQPGRTTIPAGPTSSSSKKAEGRRANADPIACLATRDRCAVLRSSPGSMS